MNRAPVVDVQTFINEQPFGGFQWLVFLMCFVIVLLDGFDTAAIGFIAPSLLGEWNLTKPDLAPVLSAALFGLACGARVRPAVRQARAPLAAARLGVPVRRRMPDVRLLDDDRTPDDPAFHHRRRRRGDAERGHDDGRVLPGQRRATVINLMFCGFPLGAAFGGFLAAWMIPHFGWRSVLILGGVTPLLLGVLLLLKMPESVRFMVANNHAVDKVRATLARISRDALNAGSFALTEAAPQTGSKGLGVVLSRSYIVGSVMPGSHTSWGRDLLRVDQLDADPAEGCRPDAEERDADLRAVPLGGVGAVLCGVLMDRFNANRVIAVCYALTAVSVYAIGQAAGNVGLLVLVVFVAGVLMNTAQSSMPALAAAFYPTEGRGTGVAWMLGVGRFGGIAGSFLVAELTRRHFSFAGVFATIAVAGLLACVALLIKQMARPHGVTQPAGKIESLGH